MPTVGIAIEVPEPFGSELRQARLDFGDPLAVTMPTHVTLVPPLEVPEADADAMRGALSRAASAHSPFSMRLRGTGTFRPVSPVVFVALSDGVADTVALAETIGDLLELPPTEFDFHPHVTVAHHVDDDALDHAFAELADFECEFQVDDFALFVHDDESGWVPEQHFALGHG